MPRITKKVVDAATADPSRKTMVWDSDLKGFALRITPAGVKSYVVTYRTAEGRQREVTIGKHGSPWTPELARERAAKILLDVRAGIDPLETKGAAREALTVTGLLELYLSDGPADKPNKKAVSWASDRAYFTRHVVPLIGRKPLKTLRRQDITKMMSDIAAGKTAARIKTGKRGLAVVQGGKGAASHAVACLGGALTFAVARGLIDENPARGIKLYAPNKIERFLSEAEVLLLAEALTACVDEMKLHPAMADAIRLLMLTGCRKGEVLGLEWAWIDFERRVIRFPDSKTGSKVTPLPVPAVDILRRIERQEGRRFVFPPLRESEGHMVGLQHGWQRVRDKATEIARQRAAEAGLPVSEAPDLTALRLHDLRHSFASFAVADGEALFLVGKVLGHKRATTTEGYAHLRDDPIKAVSDRTAARIARAMGIAEE
ncbi:site-specific integrase [Ancylobacter sp. WKF20]|uniref:site-specific integrase n=1 Tax=Ancylobacter sp. WKF20 TaxID=3039801 RepID=UPI002434143B|nr:site-specific integrase [Ancylobacter sp. WKF20]WGD32033.1 site-specific integrase [Ancylobacter sp. WKF20]